MLKAKTTRRISRDHSSAMSEIQKQPVRRLNVDVPERIRAKLKAKVITDPKYRDVSDALRQWIYEYVGESSSNDL